MKQKLFAKGNVLEASKWWDSVLTYILQITFSTVTTQTPQLALQYVNLDHSILYILFIDFFLFSFYFFLMRQKGKQI